MQKVLFVQEVLLQFLMSKDELPLQDFLVSFCGTLMNVLSECWGEICQQHEQRGVVLFGRTHEGFSCLLRSHLDKALQCHEHACISPIQIPCKTKCVGRLQGLCSSFEVGKLRKLVTHCYDNTLFL